MKVNIIDSVMGLGLDRKTVGVLRMISTDGENVSMSQLIKVLHIMEYNDWDRFDENIDSVVTIVKQASVPSGNLITITGPNDSKKSELEDPTFNLKGPSKEEVRSTGFEAATKEIENVKKTGRMKIVINQKTDIKRPYHSKEEIMKGVKEYIDSHEYYYIENMATELGFGHNSVRKYAAIFDPKGLKRGPHPRNNGRKAGTPVPKVKKIKKTKTKDTNKEKSYHRTSMSNDEILAIMTDYVNSHDQYTINTMAKDLGLSNSTIRRRINQVDPGLTKIAPNKRNQKEIHEKNSILNFIKLSDEELQRKSWLDSAVSNYSKEFKMSKSAILNPVYKKLTEVYGIVFIQKSMDFLYDHKFTPVEDYPDVSKYELLILDPELFNISKSILMDKYEQV